MVAVLTLFAFQPYFSLSVDTSLARFAPAVGDTDLGLIYIQAFNSAQTSIDVCIYSISRNDITDALIAAHNRGVQVRVIADYGNYVSIDSVYFHAMENAGIPVMHSAVGQNTIHLMHNKYAIIDGFRVITGSLNFSSPTTDANHVVVMDDPTLAAVFLQDFEEMWGSSGPYPDTLASRTGTRKLTPAVHHLTVGGREVYVFFSPQDPYTVLDTLLSVVRTARSHIFFEQWRFTFLEVADTFHTVWQRGGVVGGLVDAGSWNDNPALCMRGDGACYGTVWSPPAWVAPDGLQGRLHHKVGIFDDRWVAFGSTNWSYNGFFSNDENLVLVLDDTLADAFLQELAARWAETGAGGRLPGHLRTVDIQMTGPDGDSSALAGRRLGGVWTVATSLGGGLYAVVDSVYPFPWQGLVVRLPGGLQPGDRIHVHGTVRESLHTTLIEGDTVWVEETFAPPAPWPVSSLSSLLQEAYEGVFVEIGPLLVVRSGGGRFTVAQGSDTLEVGRWGGNFTLPDVGVQVTLRGVLMEDTLGWTFLPSPDSGVGVQESRPPRLLPVHRPAFDLLGRKAPRPYRLQILLRKGEKVLIR